MLYEKNQTEHISRELFQNPSCEYRGTPFWAWNGRLDRERLTEQIQVFRKMGLGGFHMHVRTGMESPYLEEEFMDSIRHWNRRGTAAASYEQNTLYDRRE